jgi:hypothetical protein
MKSGWVKQVLKRALKDHITNLTKGFQRSEYKFQRSENNLDKGFQTSDNKFDKRQMRQELYISMATVYVSKVCIEI